MSASLRNRLRTFFKTKSSSDISVEILRKFILPFSAQFKGRSVAIDDVIGAFFAIDDRQFYTLKARRQFKMPGKFMMAGNRPAYGIGARQVQKNQLLLAVVDRKSLTAKIELNDQDFLLEKFELEAIKDWLDVL